MTRGFFPGFATARLVERARRELIGAFQDPAELPRKVAAYTEAVRRHRESIFADVLRDHAPAPGPPR